MVDRADRWWTEVKASDDFLDRLFDRFFQRLQLPNLMRKTDYHQLAVYVPLEQIPQEITDALELIASVAERATPVGEI